MTTKEVIITNAMDSLCRSLYEITDAALANDPNAQALIRSWMFTIWANADKSGYERGVNDAIQSRRAGTKPIDSAEYFGNHQPKGCAVCAKPVYPAAARRAGPLDELVCSEACAEVVAHEHCDHHPCSDCMERAQARAENRTDCAQTTGGNNA